MLAYARVHRCEGREMVERCTAQPQASTLDTSREWRRALAFSFEDEECSQGAAGVVEGVRRHPLDRWQGNHDLAMTRWALTQHWLGLRQGCLRSFAISIKEWPPSAFPHHNTSSHSYPLNQPLLTMRTSSLIAFAALAIGAQAQQDFGAQVLAALRANGLTTLADVVGNNTQLVSALQGSNKTVLAPTNEALAAAGTLPTGADLINLIS